MKRLLRIAVLMAGLLWLAPAVRALPLAVGEGSGEGSPEEAGLVGLPDTAGVAVAAHESFAGSPADREAAAGAATRSGPGRGVPALVYVGLLGLVILGTERRVLSEALRDPARSSRREPPEAAAPLESPPSRRRDARYTRVRL